jgi:hypothetical protein
LPVAENLLDRNFTPVAPNQVWTSDITYLWTDEGWLYQAIVLDLFNRDDWLVAQAAHDGRHREGRVDDGLVSPPTGPGCHASLGSGPPVPPRTVANSDKENSRLTQTTNSESSNPALTPTANPGT